MYILQLFPFASLHIEHFFVLPIIFFVLFCPQHPTDALVRLRNIMQNRERKEGKVRYK